MKKSSSPQFTPEQELLLWSIRVDHAKDQRIEEILKAGVDWNYVRETAIQHGIIPLLYKRLKEEMDHLVPANELVELRTLFMANTVQNLRMTQQLMKVLDLLADAGIEAMPFKGPALAVQAYGDLSMRSFSDLDILIHERDFDRVYNVLLDHGYTPDVLIDSKIEKKLKLIQKKDITFCLKDTILEIHWKITERLLAAPFNMDEVWRYSLPISLNNHEAKSFSSEDMVIVLCFHGTKHAWQELKLLADLVHIISNHPEINWRELFDRSEKMGLQRIILLGLSLAQEYGGGIEIFSATEYQFEQNSTMRNIKQKIQKNFFQSQIWGSFITQELFFLKSRERLRDKMKFLLYSFTDRLLIPNRLDFEVISLPKLLSPLYLIIRPARLVKEHWLEKNRSV